MAQPVVSEPPELPQIQPGPTVTYGGSECFLVAEGTIFPGDVDWIRVRLPRASSRTVIDLDFPTGASGSALLAMVQNGTTGFNIADNNNARDALCGMNASSIPQGSTRDSVVDVRETSINAVIDIAITGFADTSFIGLHNESFAYELWVYALPYPCANDQGCNDGVACTLDQCNVATGDCANTPQDAVCDDAFFCNGVEWCDASLGCRTAGLPNCNDGVDCTYDYCDVVLNGCVNEPWDENCDNMIFCDGDEWCHPTQGCQPGEPVDCNDGVACTMDSCDEDQWDCVHTPSDGACDDGLHCNGAEHCDDGAGCIAGEYPCGDLLCRESDDTCVECLSDADCDDETFCNGMERCNAQGACAAGAGPCGEARCNEDLRACVECLSDGDCDDGVFCNGAELCDNQGVCADGVAPCGGWMCREADDTCVECLVDADCSDELFCNGSEQCDSSGTCAAGPSPCKDGQTCDEKTDQCQSGTKFSLNVHPGACPAKIVTSARGYLSAAIVGSEAALVDVRSVRLGRADGEGTPVAPVSSPNGQAPRLTDVSGPNEACVCPDAGGDGVRDLVVSFKMEDLVRSLRLDKLGRKVNVELTVTGVLKDGTPFSAGDCLIIQVPGNPNAAN